MLSLMLHLCEVPAYRPMGARAAIAILRLRYYLQLQAGNLAKPAGPTELARKGRREIDASVAKMA